MGMFDKMYCEFATIKLWIWVQLFMPLMVYSKLHNHLANRKMRPNFVACTTCLLFELYRTENVVSNCSKWDDNRIVLLSISVNWIMCFHSYGFDKREIPIEKGVFPFPLHFVGHDNKTERMKKQNLNQHILWSKSNYSKLFCGKSGTFQLFIVLHVWQRFYKRVRCP